jgi:hypothetical protein
MYGVSWFVITDSTMASVCLLMLTFKIVDVNLQAQVSAPSVSIGFRPSGSKSAAIAVSGLSSAAVNIPFYL